MKRSVACCALVPRSGSRGRWQDGSDNLGRRPSRPQEERLRAEQRSSAPKWLAQCTHNKEELHDPDASRIGQSAGARHRDGPRLARLAMWAMCMKATSRDGASSSSSNQSSTGAKAAADAPSQCAGSMAALGRQKDEQHGLRQQWKGGRAQRRLSCAAVCCHSGEGWERAGGRTFRRAAVVPGWAHWRLANGLQPAQAWPISRQSWTGALKIALPGRSRPVRLLGCWQVMALAWTFEWPLRFGCAQHSGRQKQTCRLVGTGRKRQGSVSCRCTC